MSPQHTDIISARELNKIQPILLPILPSMADDKPYNKRARYQIILTPNRLKVLFILPFAVTVFHSCFTDNSAIHHINPVIQPPARTGSQ